MLFNSYLFVFLFLPIVCIVFRLLTKLKSSFAIASWIVISSACFYAYWDSSFLLLLLISISINYAIGRVLANIQNNRKPLLVIGIIINLMLICWYKYLGFFSAIFLYLSKDVEFHAVDVFLPLGISFWTFQQISYLIDVYKDKSQCERNAIFYFAYVLFFPQLIAGPIVRHSEFIPQLARDRLFRMSYKAIIIGICVFSIGLFKKVVVADMLSPWVIDIFDNKSAYTFLEAWNGALAYTLQIYFDFSGYSDMAIGIAKMFNIDLPINFMSPYKSLSIIEFWRRWHITLSRFLRDYLYIPLGGKFSRYRNLLITMLLGGLWHGAGFTFIIWGALHGLALCINHKWRSLNKKIPTVVSWGGTMLVVIICWVFFRAHSVEQAMEITNMMFSFGNITTFFNEDIQYRQHFLIYLLILIACKHIPETSEFVIVKKNKKSLAKIVFCLLLFLISVCQMNAAPTEFLYFQF